MCIYKYLEILFEILNIGTLVHQIRILRGISDPLNQMLLHTILPSQLQPNSCSYSLHSTLPMQIPVNI